MKQRNHEYSLSVLYVCLKNLAVVLLFIYFAFKFQIWWLALIAIPFQSPIRSATPGKEFFEVSHVEITNVLTCKVCGEILLVKDIENAVHREMELKHWTRVEVDGKWWNLCPHCAEKYLKLNPKFTSR